MSKLYNGITDKLCIQLTASLIQCDKIAHNTTHTQLKGNGSEHKRIVCLVLKVVHIMGITPQAPADPLRVQDYARIENECLNITALNFQLSL